MSDPLPKSGTGKDKEIAAADWLFHETPARETPRPGGPVIVPDADSGFDLADVPESPPARASAPVEAPTDVRPRSRMAPPAGPAVEQVWSRTAEWGTTLLILACWMIAFLWLLYTTLMADMYGPAAALVIIGCLGAAVLIYPILITLERPVRVTPEQAARDYFVSLSHHLPHFRRMWLLLSRRGRTSPQFASYEGFKSYWSKRLDQLKEGHAGRFTPLVFQVVDFQSEKSGGKTEIDAKFTVKVLVRGRRKEGPIWSFPLAMSFVRGPDKMWYMNEGTLAERS
jgi:hypothetical protein